MDVHQLHPNLNNWAERVDLAAAFRGTARLQMHEAVSNHFSLAVNEDGTEFLMNRNQVHFSRIKASELLHLDANDPDTLNKPDAPDATAWGLHSAIHRHRCRDGLRGAHRRAAGPTVDGSTCCMQIAEVEFLGVQLPGDVT